ncbi:MAG: 16S rRNA (uracil(1498)-N(3))-methyltransferase [Pseudomonadota bacterium]
MVPRLFVSGALQDGQNIDLPSDQVHYLKDVLRKTVGADILVFNGRDGEFQATVDTLSKRSGTITIGQQTRRQRQSPNLTLAFAPVKRNAVATIIQKGTELGVIRFIPVLTARTNADRVRTDRLSLIAREAAEQCGRLSVPKVDVAIKLSAFLHRQSEAGQLIFCDEAGDDQDAPWGGPDGRALPMLRALTNSSGSQSVDVEAADSDIATDTEPEVSSSSRSDPASAPTTILIGPEGGFSPVERLVLRSGNNVIPVTLGPRILRSDTAAITAISLWQAAYGDLRKTSDP